jgi:glycerophosphoryl diester phosphodiesterase
MKVGSTYLETDVRITKDNKILIFHDENFERLSGINKKVIDTPSTELPLIKDHFYIHFANNKLYYRRPED